MSVFGNREDDPLLQNDPLAPSSEEDSREEQEGEPGSHSKSVSLNGEAEEGAPSSPSEGSGSVFGTDASTDTETENHTMAEGDVSRSDLLALLIENRAAIDVLFEMMAYDRADGQEEGYQQFLSALDARHEVVLEKYRDALDLDLPELWNEERPVAPEDEQTGPHDQSWT